MNKGRRLIIEVLFFIFLLGVLCFIVPDGDESFWPKGRVDVDSGNRLVMGTFARIIAVAIDSDTANNCLEAAFEELQRIDKLMSDYKSDSELSEVNRDGFEREVKVGEALFDVLKRSAAYSRETGGAFDVTVGPLVDLGRWAEEKGQALGEEEILRAREKVGFEKLELDEVNQTVRFSVEGMRLDLGGIAKGYVIDRGIEVLKKAGIHSGIIDAGGDLKIFGSHPKRNFWHIGIKHPRPHEQALFGLLKTGPTSVATSGDYERYFMKDNRRYHHILDPKTGYPVSHCVSVTVVTPSAIKADAYATAVFVYGPDKGMELIERLPFLEGIIKIGITEKVHNQHPFQLISLSILIDEPIVM